MLRVGGRWRGQADRQARESLHVSVPRGFATLPILLHTRKLVDADCSLQIHHVVFEAGLYYLVVLVTLVAETVPRILAHAVQGQHLRPRNARLVAAGDHAALPGDDVLGGVETEAAKVPERPGLASVVGGLDGVRTILDDFEVVFARDLHDWIHLAGPSRKMHGQYCPRAWCNARLDRGNIDVLRGGVDIRKHRREAGVDDRVHRRTERHRRGNHFRTGLQPLRDHADVQRRRGGIDRRDLRRLQALIGGKIALELRDAWPGPEPRRLHAGDDFIDLRLLDKRRAEDQERKAGNWCIHNQMPTLR